MQPINRRTTTLGLLGAALLFTSAAPASAETWPSRPITFVVPFTAGTTSDVIARSLAVELGAKLGQTVVV